MGVRGSHNVRVAEVFFLPHRTVLVLMLPIVGIINLCSLHSGFLSSYRGPSEKIASTPADTFLFWLAMLLASVVLLRHAGNTVDKSSGWLNSPMFSR